MYYTCTQKLKVASFSALLQPTAPQELAFEKQDSDATQWTQPPNLQHEEAKKAIVDKARRAACWGRGKTRNIFR